MANTKTLWEKMPDLDKFSDDNGRTAVLEISATGGGGRLIARANVMFHSDGGRIRTNLPLSDFAKLLANTKGRGTQKAIDAVYAIWTTPEAVEAIKTLARDHYANS